VFCRGKKRTLDRVVIPSVGRRGHGTGWNQKPHSGIKLALTIVTVLPAETAANASEIERGKLYLERRMPASSVAPWLWNQFFRTSSCNMQIR
jgi:hypothetical protein